MRVTAVWLFVVVGWLGCADGTTGGGGLGGSLSSGGGFATGPMSSTGTSFSSETSTGIGGGCAGTSSKAEPIPLDIFVMLDQSGSMLQDAGNAMTKWQTVKQALTTFIQQPNTAGIGLGIQYFGLPQPSVTGCTAFPCTQDGDCAGGCTSCMLPQGVCSSPFNPDVDSCDAIDYAWADVAIQPLPGVAPAIIGSMGMHAPGTNTPTAPALQGAIEYARAWATAHTDHVTVVALATDGDPSECDVDLGHIDMSAAAGLAGAPSILTFVIGVGGSFASLDGIAAAGGTGSAYHVDFDPMATEQLVQAMNTIRGVALKCTYEIPPPPSGMEENFDLVNVTYAPGDGSPAVTYPRVDDLASCPATGDGWYYDDPVSPKHIVLCPATCTSLGMDIMASLDIVLGCKTIVP